MHLTFSGFPAFAISLGVILVFSVPVWLGARIVGADHPTYLRSVSALVLGFVGSFLSFAIAGAFGFLLAPLAFLAAFKTVLGTSILGTLVLSILVMLGYALLAKLIGHGFEVMGGGVDG